MNGINSKTPYRAIWKKIRKLSGKFITSSLPPLKGNDNLITDPQKISQKIEEDISQISNANDYPSNFKRYPGLFKFQ